MSVSERDCELTNNDLTSDHTAAQTVQIWSRVEWDESSEVKFVQHYFVLKIEIHQCESKLSRLEYRFKVQRHDGGT